MAAGGADGCRYRGGAARDAACVGGAVGKTLKTDRKNARGAAQLLRMGWYRRVHAKSVGSQEVRALLVGRKLLQAKLPDLEFSIRGILRGFGLKVGEVGRGRFEARVRELADGHAMFEAVIGAMMQERAALWRRTLWRART
jgi:transposase